MKSRVEYYILGNMNSVTRCDLRFKLLHDVPLFQVVNQDEYGQELHHVNHDYIYYQL